MKRARPDTVFFTSPLSFQRWVIYTRFDKAPFNDVRVRRAVSLAIDAPGIVRDIFEGAGARMGPNTWNDAFDSEPTQDQMPWYKYNPAKAKELLKDAGYPDGFRMPINYFAYPYVQKQIAVVLDNLKAVGIQAELINMDNTSFNAMLRGRTYGTALTGYVTTATSANGYYYQAMHSKSASRIMPDVSNQELNRLLEASAVEPDIAKRRELFRKIYEMELDQVWRIPLAQPLEVNYIASRVRNFIRTTPISENYKFGKSYEYLWLAD